MTEPAAARKKRIVLEALDRPATERAAFVAAQCAGDAELEAEVMAMLAVGSEHFRATRSQGELIAAAASALTDPEPPMDAIGPYRLLKIIGRGGFGDVWLAERREPMVQRIALKVIKPGMDSRAVIARFEQERQTLAVMDHPNVARVFDGGVTALGRPYFVMEYVKGEPITDYCDRRSLSIRERLELFIPVCEAVQHAHHKGIIHRDLKPSNVLVAEIEGKPVPKVIDFGIAKAIDQTAFEQTVFSLEGQFIGTPEYMSPEQAGGRADVDTRTDVYSLGVMLYELLVGRLPFESSALRLKGLDEVRRIIREEEPPRPSTRLGEIGDAADRIATARRDSRASILRELRRELEWVPLKALRKERERRYDSPAALAEDLRRYLDGRPLRAAPESRAYRARKFVRRNKGVVIGVTAVVLALSAGLAGTIWQAREARAAQHAEKARAEQLKQVSEFQSQMLSQIDTTKAGVDLMKDVSDRFAAALEKAGVPEDERTRRVDALQQELVRVNATDTAAAMIDRTILKPAVETIDKQFKDQPLVDAQLRQALADLYRTIGLYDAASPLQYKALSVRRDILGDTHRDTLMSLNRMGRLLEAQGRLNEAEAYFREAIEDGKRFLGHDDPDTLRSIDNLGFLLQNLNRLDEAEKLHSDALEGRSRTLGVEHPDTLNSMNNMGFLLRARGRPAEAEPYIRESLIKRRRVLGEDHPSTLVSLSNLGWVLLQQGKLAEAEPHFCEVLEQSNRVLGELHPETLHAINNMGFLLRMQGRLDEAEPLIREALQKRRRVLGNEHPDTLASANNLGRLLRWMGRYSEAEPFCREAMESRRRLLSAEHADTLISITAMGALLCEQGRHAEAFDLLSPVEPIARRVFTGSKAPPLASFLTWLAIAMAGLNHDPARIAAAEADLLEAYSMIAQSRGPIHQETRECIQGLVSLYERWHIAEPEMGYDAKATEWRARLGATH